MKRAGGPVVKGVLLGAASLLVSQLVVSQAAQAQTPRATTLEEAITRGTPILEMNLRAAFVRQDGFAQNAEALTLRTRLGWQTAPLHGFTALLEVQNVAAIVTNYNSTVNGKTQYPVEPDPKGTEINRVQLSWTNGQGATLTGGRQRVIFDDARFVGNVGWRQDEQTFDSVRADFAQGGFSASYAYVWDVRRIFAESADWDSDSHLVNVSYAVSPALKLTGFVYALDLTQAPAQSTVTYGVRASGTGEQSGLRWSYAASWATQRDRAANPLDISLDYLLLEGGIGTGPFMLGAGYEVMQGDGVAGFSTPLATLHAFQGWADVFLATPASGIKDAYASLRFNAPWSMPGIDRIAFAAIYHDYKADRGGADLGSEINLQLSARIAERVTALLKFADYDGPAGGPADRRKVWLGLSFTL